MLCQTVSFPLSPVHPVPSSALLFPPISFPPLPSSSPLPSRYQFVTGKLPFEGDTIYKLFTSISSDELKVLPDLPQALQSLLYGEGGPPVL